jgi:hypothetical protein
VNEVPKSEAIGKAIQTVLIGYNEDGGIAIMKTEKSEQVMLKRRKNNG